MSVITDGAAYAGRLETIGRALRHYWVVAAAVLAGLLIALLPVRYSLALFGGGIVLIVALAEPLVALVVMLMAGLAEPLLAAAGLLPFPIGQVGVVLFAAAWLLRGLIVRRIYWPPLPITIPFFLYLAACALSVFFTQPPSPRDTATELLKWTEIYLIAGIVFDAAGRKKLGWAVASLLVVAATEAAIGLWQFQFRGHGPETFQILGDHFRAYGTLEQPNPFGGLMGIAWPVAAALSLHFAVTIIRTRQVSSALYLLVPTLFLAVGTLAALIISYSRGAWLGAAAAALAMAVLWPRQRWLGLGLAAAALVGLLALYSFNLLPSFVTARFADVGDFVQVYDVRGLDINDANYAIIERLAHWQSALSMAEAHPFTGVGFGNYDAAYPQYSLVNWPLGLGHAHNIYLNALAETGAIGLAAYLLLWGSVTAITLKVLSHPATPGLHRAIALGLTGCWVHLATHQFLDSLYVGNIPLYIGGLLGILCIIAVQPKPPSSSIQTVVY